MRQVTFLLVAVFVFSLNCFAQNEAKYKSLKNDIAKNDAATQDAKKGINPKTWMNRGKLFQDAYNVNIGFLRYGIDSLSAKLFFKGDPKEVKTSEENGVLKKVYVYNQIALHFENGTLKYWEETESVADNPLGKAVSAYEKAKSLDEKGKNLKKIGEAYKSISTDLENKTFNEMYAEKYRDAYNSAIQKIEVSKLIGFNDTMYYYYAGYFALAQSGIDSSMWKQAVDNFEKALSYGYKETGDNRGDIYHRLYLACINNGESEKALQYAQTGSGKYPEYIDLIYDLINYYLQRGESQKALEYVEQAEIKGPQNYNLLFAKGKLLDEMGEQEKSLAAYDAAIAVDPARYDGYYNKGVVFYNSALKLYDDANNAKTNAEFDAKMKVADEEFRKVIPLMEKAHELNSADRSIMDTLKQLYYRLKTRYPELESKYNDIVKKLE